MNLFVAPTFAQSKKVILVVGASGTPEYGEQFKQWSDKWLSAIKQSAQNDPATTDSNKPNAESIQVLTFGLEAPGTETDVDRLKHELAKTADEQLYELWLVLIGHGTFDGKVAKFNLRGPDVAANQLQEWLAPLPCRIVLINCASASGPFINQLDGKNAGKTANKNRIMVTATKSGFQHNFARFGSYLAECIGDPTIDLDKDQQTSLLEAFLAASARTQEFYVQETRLATELALLDDNGDGLGTPADWFVGTRAVEKPQAGAADGLAANQVFLFRRAGGVKLRPEQLEKRNGLELQLEQLRERKSALSEDVYFELLEPIMLELAEIYAIK